MSKTTLPRRRLLTLSEAAEYLRCSEATIRRRIRRRELPYFKPGAHLLFDPADLEAFLAASRVEAVAAWDL